MQMNTLRRLSLAYAAGSAGGLANGLAVWLFGYLGITAAIGVKIAPALTAAMLYPRLVWGGLWGFLFLLPFLKKSLFLRGVVYSILPSLVTLFIIFPTRVPNGMLGLPLGTATPLFVLLVNAIWGIVASYWLHLVEERR
ncbi:hypothetical protein [Desulfomonile tiedjei]|uniref:Uncharacterized protein n=1 Tax=Desulfomonile tiedjei (strain ATCC 49306 / DSM 6799 / DCB-1) TaxID=706587 RepID=I4CCP6_DESTA|nr:hypothetical protein [Desulfomonile tiedjei]AFM27337.1 hypothetical protein Desti_4717 [Desulfomonile tiedjei DSM 6799]